MSDNSRRIWIGVSLALCAIIALLWYFWRYFSGRRLADAQQEPFANDPNDPSSQGRTKAPTEPEDAPEPYDLYQLQGAPPYPVGYIPYNHQAGGATGCPSVPLEFPTPRNVLPPSPVPPEGPTGYPSLPKNILPPPSLPAGGRRSLLTSAQARLLTGDMIGVESPPSPAGGATGYSTTPSENATRHDPEEPELPV